ncbi:MAG: DNA polymerase III subunit delta [Bacilli bacterium]|nr:DNA polymerase III subunit delta [Bacilli bacterium]
MIYLFSSPQAKMCQMAVSKFINADYPQRDEFNYVSFDMGVTDLRTLAEECQMLPLGYDKKCILAENCWFLEKTTGKKEFAKSDKPEFLLEYLNNPDPSIDLYLLVYSDSLDEKSEMFKAIERNGQLKHVNQLTPDQWLQWIDAQFKKKGKGIDADALKEFFARTGDDLASIINESNKLICFSNGEKVTLPMVAEMVPPKLEDDSFRMINALMRGDNESAMRIYKDLKIHSIDEVRLINMLASQFRYLDEVRFLDAKGLRSDQIAKELGGSPYRVTMALKNLRNMTESSLIQTMEDLYKYESAILSGEMDAELAFTLFLANYEL